MRYLLLLILLPSLASADDLIELLGASSWKIREQASADLYSGGSKHYQLILDNIDHSDLEIRTRCRHLARSLAQVIPLKFYVGQNQKHIVYKLPVMMTEFTSRSIDDEILEQLEFLMEITPLEIHAKFILDLYNAIGTPDSVKLLPCLGTITSKCRNIDNNQYIDIIILHFEKGDGFNELETLQALSRIRSYRVYRLLIDHLLHIDNTDPLFYHIGGEWVAKKWRLEAYISVIQNYPFSYHLLSMVEHPFSAELLNHYKQIPVRSLEQMELAFKEH